MRTAVLRLGARVFRAPMPVSSVSGHWQRNNERRANEKANSSNHLRPRFSSDQDANDQRRRLREILHDPSRASKSAGEALFGQEFEYREIWHEDERQKKPGNEARSSNLERFCRQVVQYWLPILQSLQRPHHSNLGQERKMKISEYSEIKAVGSRYTQAIFSGPVVIQEKIDGSQFSF